jgi:hypothetical protein
MFPTEELDHYPDESSLEVEILDLLESKMKLKDLEDWRSFVKSKGGSDGDYLSVASTVYSAVELIYSIATDKPTSRFADFLTAQALLRILSCDIEDVPMYLNSAPYRSTVDWRLERGR